MAYSKDNSNGSELRDYLREVAPNLVLVTKKETRSHCFILERETGKVLWELPKNNSLEALLTQPGFDINKPPPRKGLGLELPFDPGLKKWIEDAHREYAFWTSQRGEQKNPAKASIYAKCWLLEIQELGAGL